MENQKVIVNLPEGFNQSEFTLNIREGEAPKQMDADVIKPVSIHGSDLQGIVSAVMQLTENDPCVGNQMILTMDKDKGQMSLVAYPTSSVHKFTIDGGVEYSKIIDILGINKDGVSWIPEKLADVLKENRHVFENPTEGMAVVSALKKLVVTSNVQFEKIAEDQKGSNSSVFSQIVESNIPQNVVMLKTSLFKGFGSDTFGIEFYTHVQGKEVKIDVKSFDLNSLRDNIIDDLFSKVSEQILDLTNGSVIVINK